MLKSTAVLHKMGDMDIWHSDQGWHHGAWCMLATKIKLERFKVPYSRKGLDWRGKKVVSKSNKYINTYISSI